MTDLEQQKLKLTVSCRDSDCIPKIAQAGRIFTNPMGERVQYMHNGIQVLADKYYSDFLTRIIEGLKGHHEPQEEKVFYEILKWIKPGATMMELGAYWGYYSLWFQTAIEGAKNVLVEPDEENLRVGQRNFELNGRKGIFIHALVGSRDSNDTQPKTVTVDGLMEANSVNHLDILHADIQGAEHEMLIGARHAFAERKVRFVFISSHGSPFHSRCLGFLRKYKYRIIVEHTRHESFSQDGLIVATADSDFKNKIAISYYVPRFGKRVRSFLCRAHSYFVH